MSFLGFTPSAFVSSKNKEKDVTISQEQKPEDFMDEEVNNGAPFV